MRKTFLAVAEAQPGAVWLEHFRSAWPDAQAWYLKEGLAARPTVAEGRQALVRHMPELLPIYESLCGLAGEDEVTHRLLSGYNPPPVIEGCSQAVWTGRGGPALVRNYDFDLAFTTGCIESTCWRGRRVIAMREAGWGCLDGMNEGGLVVSLTFGGRRGHGRGFSMPLILRYVLETCGTVEEASRVITGIPVAMAQNVTILDRTGRFATVLVGPDRQPAVTDHAVCTNHQEAVTWPEHAAASRTLERYACLAERLAAPATTLDALVDGMLRPPLYALDPARRFATVYTAVYRPAEGAVEYVWPGHCWRQSFSRFVPGAYTHDYTAAAA
jgi:predicted choloylglycine hydrolase